MMHPIEIGSSRIGKGLPPFVVAEMSGNHNGSLSRALEIVRAIAATGASALKLQTYTADTMTLDLADGQFRISDPSSPWYGENLYALYQRAHTPWEWHQPIFDLARELGLPAFSTPFDASAVEFLESLDVPAYKIASFEIIDLALIEKAAATGKPLILSTGMATIEEIDEAVTTARSAGCHDLVLLKCTSSYPADPGDSNLRTIPYLQSRFDCQVGVSDHTLGIGAAITAVGLGATMIEKHVTLSRADGGVDSAFSLEPAELAQLVREAGAAAESLGEVSFGPSEAEKRSMRFRRSLYITKDLRAGDVLTAENIRAIRPGFGLPPSHLAELLGRCVTKDVKRGTAVSWDLVKK
jgi:pseudaminic acid synthase